MKKKRGGGTWLILKHFTQCWSPAPAARESTWRDGWCRQVTMQLLIFFGLHLYFKLKILFYTFTKALGQRFDIFSSPWCRFVVSINHCCPSKGVPASTILLSTSSHVSCEYIVTHANVWAAYHIPQFISYLSKSCLSLVSWAHCL